MPTIKHRRGTASEWIATNPILADGELGFERDTNRFKLGDGLHNWTDLDYFIPDDAVSAAIASQVSLVASSVTDLSTRVVALEENPGGGGGGAVHVGPATDNPDPADFSEWIVEELDDTYGLRVSDGTTWYEISGGGGGGGTTNERPTAAFTSSIHWATVNFDASTSSDPDGFIVNYDWDFGDGSAHGSGLLPSHMYATSGSYAVILTVTDDGGRSHQVVHTVDVVRMYGPVTINTRAATFSPKIWQVPDTPNSIEWINAANGVVLATGLNPTIDFGAAGSRNIQMWCSNPGSVLTLNLGYNPEHDTGNYLPGPSGGATVVGYAGANEYRHAPQHVTSVAGLQHLPNLVNFMAAGNPGQIPSTELITGTIDFSNLTKLEFIECAYSRVQGVILDGCTSLIRLCLEENYINGGTLNLNPVRNSLKDLRCAAQGGIVLTPLLSPLTQLYHLCVRGQRITNMPAWDYLPECLEHWTWGTYQSDAFIAPAKSMDVRVYGNDYTSLDMTHTSVFGGALGSLDLSNNPLTSIVGLATGQHFYAVGFMGCGMSQALVDQVLSNVNSWNTSNGIMNLTGNSVPSGGSDNANVVALRARGWTVNIDSVVVPDTTAPGPVTALTATPFSTSISLSWTNPSDSDLGTTIIRRTAGASAPAAVTDGIGLAVSGHPTSFMDSGLASETQYSYGVWAVDSSGNVSLRTAVTVTTAAPAGGSTDTLIWEDTFNRADASGTANVGNGWYGTSPLNIISNQLQRTNGAYQIHLRDDASTTIPRSQDVAIEIDIPAASMGPYLGIAARAVVNTSAPAQSGVRAFMHDGINSFSLGNCSSYDADGVSLTTVAAPPASWGTNAINTFRLELRGNNATILCNGTIVRTGVIPTSAQGALADSAFGICGEGNGRYIDAIRVYSLT